VEDSRKRILVVTLALGASAGCREGRNLQSVIVNDAGVGGAGASAGAGGGGSGGAGGGEHGAGGQGSGGAALPEDRVHSRRRGRPEHPSQVDVRRNAMAAPSVRTATARNLDGRRRGSKGLAETDPVPDQTQFMPATAQRPFEINLGGARGGKSTWEGHAAD